METLVALCKRRGFIFPSSEIYGGFNGFYDYGPLGVELRENIKRAWWHDMVHCREDVVGIDASIVMNPAVWRASGHLDGFTDPMVDCRESKMRFRADQLFFSPVTVDGVEIGYVSVLESHDMDEEAEKLADKLIRKQGLRGRRVPLSLRDYTEASPEPIRAYSIAGHRKGRFVDAAA